MSQYEVWNLYTLRLIARYRSVRTDTQAVQQANEEFAESPWQEYMVLESFLSGGDYRFVYCRGLVGKTPFVISNILEEEEEQRTYQIT